MLSVYFGLNSEHSPRILAKVENRLMVRSQGGEGMLKIKIRRLVYIYRDFLKRRRKVDAGMRSPSDVLSCERVAREQ